MSRCVSVEMKWVYKSVYTLMLMYWICDIQAQRRAGVEIQADGKADVLVLENKAASDQSKSPKVPKKMSLY